VLTLAGMARLSARRALRPPPAAGAGAGGPDGAAVAELRARRGATLGLRELQRVLVAYGIPCARARMAATPAQAAAVAPEVGWPVAVKVLSPQISHKTDVGGVRLGLGSPRDVEAAAAEVLAAARGARPEAPIDGVLVQQMAPPGKEVLLGMVRDAQFGPTVIVGLGGIYVEVLNDTAARLCPVTTEDALDMLSELRMAPLLHGVRGEPPVDLEALAAAIRRFARLATDVPALAEIEINPLMAGAHGVMAVDARARLGTEA
jgi:acyl-CoA synthetase (NDP forming)